MGKLVVVGVIANYYLARVFAFAARVRYRVVDFAVGRLVKALCDNEDASTAAYMALVKLGPGNADRLLSHARRAHMRALSHATIKPHEVGDRGAGDAAAIINVLGSLDDTGLIPQLEQFVESPIPRIAESARESIETLRTI